MHPRAPLTLIALACLFAGAAACGDGGTARAGTCGSGLLPGDLVITEILANPKGTDAGKEWFEIYNATDAPIDLTGLLLRTATAEGGSIKEHAMGELSIEPGQYLVVGNTIEEVRPDYVDYGYGKDLGDLRNTAGTIAVSCGNSPIDVVLYDGATDGVSRGFDGARPPDATANDDLTAWCNATSQFNDELVATPGAANDACAGVGVPTTCTEDGVLRDILAPQPGDLVISEFHADPQAVADADGEWFEIYANTRVDLNGVSFARVEGEPDGGIAGAECITIEAGGYFVVARKSDPAVNGGLPVVDATFSFSLGNSGGAIILGYGEAVLDQIAWTRSTAGAASALDPAHMSAEGNDNPLAFCAAQTPYGAGDRGTPGAANDVRCDVAPPDGQCFDGTAFIDAVPPAPGDLVITEFIANPAAVDDPLGEWIEVRANAPVHLNGLQLGRDGEVQSTINASDCIFAGAGDHLVIARNADPAVNGGVTNVAAVFSFALVNSNGNLFIGTGGTVLDEITWASSVSGASTALDPSITDPAGNDDPAAWCTATAPYGDGDLGTPGEENPVCGGTASGTCLDGGVERDVVVPTVGDLVITELMPNSSAVTDANGEWFEVHATNDVDLNGLRVGWGAVPLADPPGANFTLSVLECVRAPAGSYVLFARNSDATVNGGLPAVDVTVPNLQMANGDERYLALSIGTELLDAVTYVGTVSGVARSLDPAHASDPAANDDLGYWCAATNPYSTPPGNLGTPGAANPGCGGPLQPGQCLQGGVARAIVPASDVRITEVMTRTNGATDANMRWFELRFDTAGDLNGVEVGREGTASSTTVTSNDCIPIPAGGHAILARSANLGLNGLPYVDAVFNFTLTIAPSEALYAAYEGTILDSVVYPNTPVASQGTSQQRDANDVFCTSQSAGAGTYGADGNVGTPGSASLQCL